MYIYKPASLLIGLFLLLSGCADQNQQVTETFTQRFEALRPQYAPDLSLNLLSAELKKEDGGWVLKGETTVPDAAQRVQTLADSLLGEGQYRNEFTRLPDPALGDSCYGLVRTSVIPLRGEPRHSAEQVDQNIMGRVLTLHKRNDRGWYLVQTDYGYLGWVIGGTFVRTDRAGVDAWEKASRVRVTALAPMIRTHPDDQSEPVCDVVLNALLKLEGKRGEWLEVSTPDGRSGFLKAADAVGADAYAVPPQAEALIATARSMMGIPYLWGGNSSKASDCSGFTQTVFKAHGIDILRDARQQARAGEAVVPDENFSNIRPGDLFFFGSGGRITHVGMSLGGARFIHQSGDVRINSLDPAAADFSPYRKRTFMQVQRVVQ